MDADRTLFENDDWTVDATGLEHRETGYLIEREQIGRRRADGFWAWPPHMLEKTWVVPETFAEAFSAAARLFGLEAGDAPASTFAEAGWVETATGWHRRTAEVVPHPALSAPGEERTGERNTGRRRQIG
jgi:hypothetical protein